MALDGQGEIWGPLQPAQLSWDEDGSPRSERHDDIYFAPGRGVEETRFVFLDGIGAPRVWQDCKRFTIAETGFGSGLNFFVTVREWLATAQTDSQLDYVSIEKHPLSTADILRAIEPYAELKEQAKELAAQLPPPYPGFHRLYLAGGRVRLTLLYGDASAMLERVHGHVDAWYLDGFAPSKNPDMWTDALFQQIARLSASGARLATFTAAGAVRRGLQAVGLQVTRSAGFAGKRERITASMPGQKQEQTHQPKKVGIVGAGIAGLCIADALMQRGHAPILIDATGDRLQETSGNPAALFSPKPGLGYAPYDRLLSLSWIAATRYYDRLQASRHPVWLTPRGLVKIPHSEKEATRHPRVAAAYDWPEWMQPTDEAHIFPSAGSLDTAAIGNALASDCAVVSSRITSITQSGNSWTVETDKGEKYQDFDAIVLANGHAMYDLLEGLSSPIIPNRGQIEVLNASAFDDTIPSQSFGKYLSAPVVLSNGTCVRVAGASNRRLPDGPPDNWSEPEPDERATTLDAIRTVVGERVKLDVIKSRVGLRATTPDHMPITGPVPDADAIAMLPPHPKKLKPYQLGDTCAREGLYTLGGLGARGYMIAPLLAETIASQIDDTPLPLDRDILDAISPARFPLAARLKE